VTFNNLLAPFIAKDSLTYGEVKQAMQRFIFDLNYPSRAGSETPFSNVMMNTKCPETYAEEEPWFMPGNTYSDFQDESLMILRAFNEVLVEGDGNGNPFTFPLPTINVLKSTKFTEDVWHEIGKTEAKYGSYYFMNFNGSGISANSVRALCCRLILDLEDLPAAGGRWALQGSTGSLGICTINMAKLGYLAGDDVKFFEMLNNILERIKVSLLMKEVWIRELLDGGYLPMTRTYGIDYDRYFRTIGVVGLHEMTLNLLGEPIWNARGFISSVLNHIRDWTKRTQVETGKLWNLEMCVTPDTLVITDSGVVKIENIKENDGVLGLDGKIHKVTSIYNRNIEEEILEINPYKSPKIRMTLNDTILGVSKSALDAIGVGSGSNKKRIKNVKLSNIMEWICAEDIQKGDLIAFPISKFDKHYSIKISDIIGIEANDGIIKIGNNSSPVPNEIILNEDFGAIIGFYLSEGYCSDYVIEFCNDDLNLKNKIKVYIKNVFGLNSKISPHKVTVCSKPVALLLKSLCGRLSRNKYISRILMGGPAEFTKSIIDWMFYGDGSSYRGKRNTTMLEYVTMSKDLASDLKILLLSKGIMPSINHVLSNHGFTKDKNNRIWRLRWCETNGKGQRSWMDGSFAFYLIKDVKKIKYKGKVHDLRVDGIKSFTTLSGVVHNTPAEGAATRLAFKDREMHPGIITQGTDDAPYYTSMITPPSVEMPFTKRLNFEEKILPLFTGGTVFRTYIGEQRPDPDALIKFISKMAKKTKIPYYDVSPTYSICRKCGTYHAGTASSCTSCGGEVYIYDRIVGYYRNRDRANVGKLKEIEARTAYNIFQ